MDKKELLKNYLYIFSGVAFVALGIALFLIPANLITGGTPGISMLLHYLTGFSIGSMMVAINVPLLLIGARYVNKTFAINTVVTIVLTSLCIDFLTLGLKVKGVTTEPLLGAIFGGIFIGTGLALILRGNSSAGGPSVIARIIASKTHIKAGRVILVIDFLIITSSMLVFDNIEQVLWSMISIYTTAICIDKILTGTPSTKIVHIVTSRINELSTLINETFGPAGTVIKGTALHHSGEKNMIFMVIEVTQLAKLKALIRENDPKAFLIVMNAYELLGRGYK